MIENFLDEEYFDSLVTFVTKAEATEHGFMPWFFQPNITFPKNDKKWKSREESGNNSFYMNHTFYTKNQPTSNLFDNLVPLLDKIGTKCLLRVKANLYPNTEILHENPMHKDYNFSHSGALFSLNTCDGYTKLKDGTKIDSIANRILLFDPSEEHCSATTTNVPARFNININYINVETPPYVENKIQK